MGRRAHQKTSPQRMTLREALLLNDVPFWTSAAVAVLDELPASLALNSKELSELLPLLTHPERIPEPYGRRAQQIATAFRQFSDQRCRDGIGAEFVRAHECQLIHNERVSQGLT